MKIDSELTEKSAQNTQRWWKLTATIVGRAPGPGARPTKHLKIKIIL